MSCSIRLYQRRDLLPQLRRLALRGPGFLLIRCVERRHVATDAGFDLLHAPLHLGAGEVSVPVVHRLELAAIHRDHRLRQQVQLTAENDELSAYTADSRAIVLAEIGDRFEIRHQSAGQPHQFDIALGLALQATARLDAVAVAIETDLQQCRRMIAWPPCRLRAHARKTQPGQIELSNEDIDHPNGVIIGYVVLQTAR